MKMTEADVRVVLAARQALAATVARLAARDVVLPLIAVAVTGLLADMVSAAPGARELVAVVNQQLAGSGWKVIPVKRN